MDDNNFLQEQFEANRSHLRVVAFRILGNTPDVDDALQDAWLRISATSSDEIANVTGWLTTIVARICLNTLRSRKRQPIEVPDEARREERFFVSSSATPEEQAVLADSMGMALLVVLDLLSPAERIAFVLHDLFSLTFDEIGEILGKSTEACRQLASRARRRVRSASEPSTDVQAQREIVDAFLRAAREGDFQSLLSLLHPDVELVSDSVAVALGAPERRDGPFEVATRFSGGAQSARLAFLDGRPGLVWSQGGAPLIAFDFTVEGDVVTRIEMIGDADVLSEIDVAFIRRTRPS